MTTHRPLPALLGAALVLAALTAPVAVADEHTMLASGAQVKWGPPPPVLPRGAQFAVIDGDPAATGLVTVRMKLPAGYQIPPHFHPTDEHVTVLAGTLSLGMGDTIDKAHSATLGVGGYAVAPAKMHHYAWTAKGATIQIHLMGPFALTYVNPADDPTHAK